jgi:hypothetical protein
VTVRLYHFEEHLDTMVLSVGHHEKLIFYAIN